MAENVDEQVAIRGLMNRGRKFTIAFFTTAEVTEDDLARVYYGWPVGAPALERIKKVLRERMPKE